MPSSPGCEEGRVDLAWTREYRAKLTRSCGKLYWPRLGAGNVEPSLTSCTRQVPYAGFARPGPIQEQPVPVTKCVDKSEGNTNLKKDLPEEEAPADDKASVDSSKDIKGAVVKAATESAKKSTEEKKKPSEKESSDKEIEFSITILNIQVGLIRKAWKHPSADSLLVEEIDLGDGNLRQVVSGLAKYYSPDDLINRLVVLITNVKAGKLRDVMSCGLVLCASNQENSTVEPLIPPEGAKIGERVSFLGFEGKPEDVLNPKKKQLEKITPHLYTDDKGVATYKGISFMTSAGPCTSSIANATIK